MPSSRVGVHTVPALPHSVTDSVARTGWLEDWRLAAVLLVAAAGVTAGWVVLAIRARRTDRQPRHRVLRRIGFASLVGILFLAGIGAGVNAYVGYAPDVSSLQRSIPTLLGMAGGGSRGTLVGTGRYPARLVSFAEPAASDRIPMTRSWVYLPPGYDDPANAQVRYPTVYLVHGWPGTSYDWFGAGRAADTAMLMQQQGLIRPMILVAADARGGVSGDTECLNSTTGGPQLETFLSSTLVSDVDRTFRTIPDRALRAIGGVSSGGYCALNLGLRDQQSFGAVLAMMPYGDPGANAIRGMLGGSTRLGWSNSPADYVTTIPLHYRQSYFLATGRADRPTYRAVEEMARVLAGRGDFVSLRINAGLGHNWREARYELPYALAFASARLSRALPTSVPPPVPTRRTTVLGAGFSGYAHLSPARATRRRRTVVPLVTRRTIPH